LGPCLGHRRVSERPPPDLVGSTDAPSATVSDSSQPLSRLREPTAAYERTQERTGDDQKVPLSSPTPTSACRSTQKLNNPKVGGSNPPPATILATPHQHSLDLQCT